jgi:phosphoribosylglycinamide formyltransferase 2
LHIRAILGLPLDFITYGSGVSAAYKSRIESVRPTFELPDDAFSTNSFVRVFGKPESHKGRRMAVALVYGDIESSMKQAKTIIENIRELK